MSQRLSVACLAATLLFAPALAADEVHLRNGRVFEDVVAEEGERGVRIRIAGGELTIPRQQILRVERQGTALAEYLAREAVLRALPEASADEWLELARWARARGLRSAARQAALAAAELSPRLAGLEDFLRSAGLVLDAELGRWIPYEESMRRRGFVEDGGEWVSREELAARERRAQREQLADLELARARLEARRAEAELAGAIADLRAPDRDADREVYFPGYPIWSYVAVPVVVPPHRPHPPHRPEPTPPEPAPRPPETHRNDRGGYPLRVPGSLIQGVVDSAN